MHSLATSLLVLVVLLAGAALAPVASARVRVPAAVLLIFYGIAVGRYGLGLLPEDPVEGFLSELGFLLLMFLAGLEIAFNALRHGGARTVALITTVSLLIMGISMVVASQAGLQPIQGLALGAISVGMPLAVLKETGQLRTRLGQVVLLVGSIGEFLTVIVMTLLDLGLRHGSSIAFAWGILRLVGFLAVSGLVLRVLGALAWWHPEQFGGMVSEHTSEIGVRVSLLGMAFFSLVAVMAGVEPIVGSFLAGTLLAFVLRGKEVLEEKLAVVGHGLFVPIFFIGVGLRFDPGVISPSSLVLTGWLLLAVLLARLVPGLLLVGVGVRARDAVAASTLLSSPLTLMVAIATLGAELGALSEEAKGTLILLALASGVVFPLAFRAMVSGPAEEEEVARS